MSNKGLNSHPSADTANYTPHSLSPPPSRGEEVFLYCPPHSSPQSHPTDRLLLLPAADGWHSPGVWHLAMAIFVTKRPPSLWSGTQLSQPGPHQASPPTRLLRFLVSPTVQNVSTSPPTLRLQICCRMYVGCCCCLLVVVFLCLFFFPVKPVLNMLSLITKHQSAARLPHVAVHDSEPIAPSDVR